MRIYDGIADNTRMASKGAILQGYKESLVDSRSRERYEEKLELINGKDPCELPKQAWKDDVDLWPCITYINVGMYLVFSLSAYTGEALMNYKSVECYIPTIPCRLGERDLSASRGGEKNTGSKGIINCNVAW